MHAATALLVIGLLAGLGGCRSAAPAAEQPARLIDPTAASRAELAEVVAAALGRGDVMLAADALTESSVLLIARTRHVDDRGRPLMGRDFETPERFRLLRADADCVLVHAASERRWTLTEARCEAE